MNKISKALKLINPGVDEEEMTQVLREIEILRRANNPYVLSHVEDFRFYGQHCIVSEYCIVSAFIWGQDILLNF
jgi:serine/threonine protein kinase